MSIHVGMNMISGNEYMEDKRIRYEKFTTGTEFSPSVFEMDGETVAGYLEATEDNNDLYKRGIVPPMAVAAMAMQAMSERVELPPGTIHTSQKLEFCHIVRRGEKLTSFARVIRKIARGKFHMFSIGIEVRNENGEVAITGELGFILPLLKEKKNDD